MYHMVAFMFTDILDCLKKKKYNNTIKTWIWQGILHSVECMYYTVHVCLVVSKIAFGFAFIVKNVYRYVKHFRD